MPRSSKPTTPAKAVAPVRDPQKIARVILGVLLLLDLVAAGLLLYPPGGSADSLDREMASLQSQIKQKRALVEQTRQHSVAVTKGVAEGDKFLTQYFLARRTVASTLLAELTEAGKTAGVKERGNASSVEPIEGSDSLAMMTITANYEGTYRNIMNLVHEIDKSPRLLIIESLNAQPQQGSNTLVIQLKLEAFVRDEAGDVPSQGAPPASAQLPVTTAQAEAR